MHDYDHLDKGQLIMACGVLESMLISVTEQAVALGMDSKAVEDALAMAHEALDEIECGRA